MAAGIKVFGKEYPKPVVWAVAIGGAGVVYFVWKQKTAANAAAAAAASSGSATDPVTGLPYSEDNQVDPITGMTYLSEAQEYGSVSAADASYQSEAESSIESEGGGNADVNGLTGLYSSDSNQALSYASNAQWAQAVTAGLSDIGYNATDVGAALGVFLAGLPETTAQATIVQTALAEYGEPPTGNLQIIMATTTTTTPTAGTCSSGYTYSATQTNASGEIEASGGPGWCELKPATTVANGTCPSGYTFSSSQTGASGEIAAAGGAGWCELNPVTTTTPPPPPPPSGGVTVQNYIGVSTSALENPDYPTNLPLAVYGSGPVITAQNPAAGTQVVPNTFVNLTAGGTSIGPSNEVGSTSPTGQHGP
jgi:hypothetical protein